MDPFLTVLRLGPVERPIGNYGVLLALAMLITTLLAARAASRAKIDVGATFAVAGFVAAGGLGGAALLFLVVELLRTGTLPDAPGLVFFGGPIGGAVAYYVMGRQLDLPLGRLIDVATPAFPIGHALGRVGCFLGGCCFGRPWDGPWAVTYTHPIAPASVHAVSRHPVQLYESVALLLLALVLSSVPPRHVGKGRRFFVYLAAYGLIRVVTETFRGDSIRGVFLGVSTSQLIGVAIFLAAATAWWTTRPDGPSAVPRASRGSA